MNDLNDIYYFIKVVEYHSFTEAAQFLGIPKSRLSRRVAALERHLGVKLLHRTTRHLSLTMVGQKYYDHCKDIANQIESAHRVVLKSSNEPEGDLRVSSPESLASSILFDIIPEFLERYPKISLDLLLTEKRIDLVVDQVDVAMRVRSLDDEDPDLVSLRLMPGVLVLVASPDFLKKYSITQPSDLLSCPMMGVTGSDKHISFTLSKVNTAERYHVNTRARLSVTSFKLRKMAALQGLGVTLLPTTLCDDELNSGELVHVLPTWSEPQGYVSAVYTGRNGLLPSASVWIDFLKEKLLDRPKV